MYTLDQLWRMEMAQLIKERETSDPDPDIWRWSPLDIRDFDMMLQVAVAEVKRYNPDYPKSYAEAGSGIGTKLWLAKYGYGLTEHGYEINAGYIEQARQLGVYSELRDLSDEDDQPPWGIYDIVYAARMYKDDMKQVRWERQLQDDMTPGSVLMMSFCARKPYTWRCLYRRPYRGVWVKPITPPRVDEPHAKAVSVLA